MLAFECRKLLSALPQGNPVSSSLATLSNAEMTGICVRHDCRQAWLKLLHQQHAFSCNCTCLACTLGSTATAQPAPVTLCDLPADRPQLATIEDCVMAQCAQHGVLARDGAKLSLMRNSILNNKQYGLYLKVM